MREFKLLLALLLKVESKQSSWSLRHRTDFHDILGVASRGFTALTVDKEVSNLIFPDCTFLILRKR